MDVARKAKRQKQQQARRAEQVQRKSPRLSARQEADRVAKLEKYKPRALFKLGQGQGALSSKGAGGTCGAGVGAAGDDHREEADALAHARRARREQAGQAAHQRAGASGIAGG